MTITSLSFALFVLLVIGALASLRGHLLAKKLLLVVASCLFYATYDLRFVAIVLVLACLAWLSGRLLIAMPPSRRRRAVLLASVFILLAPLLILKYTPLSPGLTTELDPIGLDGALSAWLLPIGISFYTFQAISYPLDLARGRLTRAYSLLDLLFYLTYFPKLLVGPIAQSNQFLPQAEREFQIADSRTASSALWLILSGLVKKLVFADIIAAEFVDPAFDRPDAHGSLFLIVALYAYSMQIYFDIAGYTDIVRGVSRLIGIELPHNFNRPYLARTVSNFWQRWHVSMSSFFREYLYYSIGGSRRGNVYANLMITFVAIGLWHGAGWSFLIYGVMHGVVVGIERYRRSHDPHWRPDKGSWLRQGLNILLVFSFVTWARVLFRADDIEAASYYLSAIATAPIGGISTSLVGMVTLAGGMLLHFTPPSWARSLQARFTTAPAVNQATAGVLMVSLVLLIAPTSGGFIYAQF